MRIAIVDYGAGNLRSISRGLEKAGAVPLITDQEDVIKKSDAVVLPGVGAFADAIKNLKPLEKTIKKSAEEKPILGICLGLQLFFTESEENGLHQGLDFMRGRVVMLPKKVKIPHMGWNSIKIKKESRLLEGIKTGDYFYFVHSYYAEPKDGVTIATTKYGLEFPAIVERDNVFAVQFHPEKSGEKGLRLLRNFVGLI